MWNNLPQRLKSIANKHTVKTALKKHLLNDYNRRYVMPKKTPNKQKKNKNNNKPKKKKKKKKGKVDLTTVLHIRELPHLHMKLTVWFSFPTTNNKNQMIPS